MALKPFRNSHYDPARGAYIIYERKGDLDEFEILAKFEHQLHPDTPIVIHHLDGSEEIIKPSNGADNGKRTPIIKNGEWLKD